VGGLNTRLGQRIGAALKAAGFVVGRQKNPKLQGLETTNLCNRGKKKAGVQLELSQNVRKQMFASLTREGQKKTKPAFRRFVEEYNGFRPHSSLSGLTPNEVVQQHSHGPIFSILGR